MKLKIKRLGKFNGVEGIMIELELSRYQDLLRQTQLLSMKELEDFENDLIKATQKILLFRQEGDKND